MDISSKTVIYSFSGDNVPVKEIDPPDSVTIETADCFSNQLRSPEDKMDELDWTCINPASGPIYIKGAEPGDTLRVTIDKIDLDSKGTVCCMEGEGVLGHLIEGSHIRIAPVENGFVKFLDFSIPVKKMVGVIGVAPKDGDVSTGTPGPHGGNMDTLMITEGASVYFPVFVKGALFALGDCHAVMGDGEIGVSGLEIPANVKVTFELIKGNAPEYPFLENDESFAVLASKPTVDEAVSCATELMCKFLEKRMTEYSRPEIIMLMSLVGNVEISQVVDPEKTVRFVFPKKYTKGASY